MSGYGNGSCVFAASEEDGCFSGVIELGVDDEGVDVVFCDEGDEEEICARGEFLGGAISENDVQEFVLRAAEREGDLNVTCQTWALIGFLWDAFSERGTLRTAAEFYEYLNERPGQRTDDSERWRRAMKSSFPRGFLQILRVSGVVGSCDV